MIATLKFYKKCKIKWDFGILSYLNLILIVQTFGPICVAIPRDCFFPSGSFFISYM